MTSDSRPFARGVSLALCVFPLLLGLTGPRTTAATRLSPRVTPSAPVRPAAAPKVAAPAVRRSQKAKSEREPAEAAAIPLGARDTGPARRKAGKLARPALAPPNPAPEVEPNDDTSTATPLPGSRARMRGNIYPVDDADYYSFTAAEGDRVYAATGVAFADDDGSTDTILDVIDSDGTTILETDDDDGSFDKGSSSIAGAEIPTAGTYYLRVTDSNEDEIRPYDLYFQLRSGSPTAEEEPNNSTATAQPLPESGWVSGATSSDLDEDYYSVELNSGDTVYLGLDCDPERDMTEWVGRVGLASFGDPAMILTADNGGTSSPYSQAFFVTVRATGTYYVFVGGDFKGDFGTYDLSVSVLPRTDACTQYFSTDGSKTIGDGLPGFVSSTVTIPGNPRVGHLRVNIDLDHDLPSDLQATLTSPEGSTVVLFNSLPGDSSGQTHAGFTLDDDAALPITSFDVADKLVAAPDPDSRLGWFDGVDAGGQWTLTLYDTVEGNGGTLNAWGLEICEDTSTFCDGGGTTSTLLDEDFEADNGGFTHGGSNDEWEWGTPTAAPIDSANSGEKCWKTDLTGTYENDSYQDLVSPPIVLSADGEYRLSWAQKYQLESAEYDHAWVEVREVSDIRGCRGCGGLTRRIWEHLGPTMEASVGEPEFAVEEAAGWGVFERDISDFAGLTVQVVWHLDSDDTVTYAGYAVDDVKLERCANAANADLSITLSDAPDPVAAGGQITYTFMAGEGGPDDAGATTVSLPLPAGTTFVSATAPAGWTPSTPTVGTNGTVTFTNPSFVDCDSATFTVVAAVGCSVADGTVLSAIATVTGTTGDNNPGNNSATAMTTVANADPTIASCPSNVSTPADAGLCTAVVTYTTPTATDDAGCTATVACLPASGTAFPVGVTTVTCTATDAANQTGTCSFTVTVTDAVPPVIGACPASTTVVASTPTGQPFTYTSPTATDNCTVLSVVCTPASGSTFALGTTTVTCTATDLSSNTASCSFTVTVVQHDTVGIYVPSTNAWFLRYTNTGGNADLVYTYGGGSSLVPIKGDWDDDGVDTPGLYNPTTGTFFLKNSNAPGNADLTFNFGAGGIGYIPIAGDWDNMNGDSVGLYNPATGAFFLKNSNSSGDADIVFVFGAGGVGYLPVAGDWDGADGDSIGLYNPATSVFFLKNDLAGGDADFVFQFGQTAGGYLPIAGDWNNDGADTIGIYKPSTAGFFLTDTIPNITADYIFVYGPTDATPIVGNWDGF